MAGKSRVVAVLAVLAALQAGESAAQEKLEAFAQSIPTSTVSLQMVPIPAGDGVGAFWISKTEVPWDIFDVWMFARDQGMQVATGKGEEAVSRPSRPYVLPGRNFGHDGFPALGMSYHAATVFARWVSSITGYNYRLPTQDEWERACKAGQSAPTPLAESAWYFDNGNDKTHAVGTRAANAFGLSDMLGNAGEWVTGRDGEPLLMGGSFTDPAGDVSCTAGKKQTDAWQASDPQLPKSEWWLTDAPFVGMRLVRVP